MQPRKRSSETQGPQALRVLTTAREIRAEIRNLFADPSDVRIITVAFVGQDACQMLPSPKGIKLYCWPQPGGTNPVGVEGLLNSGVQVEFVDRLHSKIYWSKSRGALIGSANLSANGLADGGLVETMVLLPPGVLDMEKQVKTFTVNPDFGRKLKWLHKAHILFQQRNPSPGASAGTARSPEVPTFGEWFKGVGRQEWRLTGAAFDAKAPKDALKVLKDETGSETHQDFYAIRDRTQLEKGVYSLGFRYKEKDDHTVSISGLYWWAPDNVVVTNAKGWECCRYVFFAKRMRPAGTSAPFQCREPKFRLALEATINILGGSGFLDMNRCILTNGFINKLNKNYANNSLKANHT